MARHRHGRDRASSAWRQPAQGLTRGSATEAVNQPEAEDKCDNCGAQPVDIKGGEDDGAAARTGVLATRSSDVTDCFTVLASLHGGAGPAGGVGEEDERQAARESRKWIEDRCATGRACV